MIVVYSLFISLILKSVGSSFNAFLSIISVGEQNFFQNINHELFIAPTCLFIVLFHNQTLSTVFTK